MSYTVKIGFTGGDRVFSVLKGTIETNIGAQGKHATQSTPVKVQSATCAALLLVETKDLIPAALYHDNTVLFEGFIRPYRTIGAKGPTEDPVSLEIMDNTEYMHQITGTDVVWNNKTVAELVDLIYDASGAAPTLGSIPAALSAVSFDRFRLASDEYWDEVLGELLYEYGYDYVFKPGVCEIQPTSISATPNQAITDIRNAYKVAKNDNSIDGTIVEYKKVSYAQGVRLYSDDTRYDSTKTGMFGQNISGNYYNGLMHNDQVNPPAGNLITWDFSSISDLKSSEVLSVSNVRFSFRLDDEDNVSVEQHFDESGSDLLTGARWWLHYSGRFNRVFGVGWGWVVKATGDITYYVNGNWEYRCEGLDPKRITAKYISNENAAKAMAEREYKRYKVCQTKFTFDSLTDYNLGEFYTLTETTVGADTVVRIIGKSLSSDGIYTYQCEGADTIGLSVSVEELQVRDIDVAGGILNLSIDRDILDFPTDTVQATLSGYITTQPNVVYKWYINGTLEHTGSSTTRSFYGSVFQNGINILKVEAWNVVSGETDVLMAIEELKIENIGNPLVSSVQQYYISESKDELIGGSWTDTQPVSYDGFLWYRTKYVYSDGTVTYSQYAHYLTTAEIDAPWVLSTMFAVSSSDDWEQADTAQPPVQGVTYYERLLDGSLREADVSEGWTQGVSYYFIPDCTAWGNSIPSSWRHGLYIWSRDTITYTLNGISQRMIPVYSASATSDAERTCKFVVTPSSYTWAKNKRAVSSDNVSVTFGYEIQGYGENVEPLITVPSGYDITVSNNSIQFNSAIALDRMEIFVSLAQFSDVTPVKIVLESVDVTDEPTYLGILTAMPSSDNTRFSRFLAGDHFVANGITGKTSLMPYVYDGVNWVTPSRNGVYGPMAYIQILYNCVHDIFSNAQDVYTLCGTGATAQEGVSYYQQIDGVWTGVVVRTGEDVSTLYTKGTNVPSQVLEYYNYQAEIIADYVASNDIQLVEQTDPVTGKTKVGKIRSAGYEKGTVKTLIETAQGGQSLASYKQGFYGDTEGNFEAFDAWLYRANIYNANIVGELRNDLFFTNLEAKVGATYTQSTLTNESWSGTKALESVRSAIGSGNVEKILSMGAHYPTQGNQYSLGMLVDNPARAVEASVNAGATFTSPIFTAFTASLPLFNSGNVPVSGGDIYYGSVLTNRKRWAISSLYENADITANVLNASGISWNGTNLGYARVTNPGATAVGATSQGTVQSWSWRWTWQTIHIPSWYKNATISMTLYRVETSSAFRRNYSQGQLYVNINGERRYTIGSTINGSDTLYLSYTVNGGDEVSVYFGGDTEYDRNTEQSPGWAWSISAQTFSAIGFTETGFYTFSQTTGYDGSHVYASNITNRNNHPIYYQEDATDTYYEKAAVTLSSPSWSSANHLLSATVNYTYEKYQTGLNLVNSNGERQQTVTTGAHPVSEYFDVTYGGTVRYKSDTAQHYWHINSAGILSTGGSLVDSAKIFAIDSCTAYYKLFGDNSRRNITGVTGVIWTNSSIIFETANGNVIVSTSDWVAEFYVNLVSQSQRRGNFADTILPIMSEADRALQNPVKKINLGAPENRFDGIYSKEVGARLTPIEDTYSNNGMIKNVNLIPVSVTAFEQGLTYYYFLNGVLTAETAGSPVSGRQYFLLNTGGYGHFDVLSMLDSATSQRKRIDELYIKLSAIEQSLSSSTTKVPSSKAVNDAIMNITDYSRKDASGEKEFSLSINGYVLKWVYFNMRNGSPTTYIFKEPFPTGCLIAGGNVYGSNEYTTLHLQYNATSLTAYTNTNQNSEVCCWAFGF